MANNWSWLGINDEGAAKLDGMLTGVGERRCTMRDGPAQGVECIVPNNAVVIQVTHKHVAHEYVRRDDGEFWYGGKSFPRVYARVF